MDIRWMEIELNVFLEENNYIHYNSMVLKISINYNYSIFTNLSITCQIPQANFALTYIIILCACVTSLDQWRHSLNKMHEKYYPYWSKCIGFTTHKIMSDPHTFCEIVGEKIPDFFSIFVTTVDILTSNDVMARIKLL